MKPIRPAYTELHRHLDASLRPETLLKLLHHFEVETEFQTVQDIKQKFWITQPMNSLKEVLDCFVLFQKVLRTCEVLEQIAFEAIEDAAQEGISQIELRYSPTFTGEYARSSWKECLDAFLLGMRKGCEATGVRAGLICIVSRGYGMSAAEKTMDFALEHRESFIGVDLAGIEDGFPCRNYAVPFRRAIDAGLPVTIHAGEAAGAENVWEAIDVLGAKRIGHGIRAIQDAELIKRLARDQILLETCPTSNVLTRSVESWDSHPLPRLLSAGVPVSVNTDDPGIFGVTLGEEFSRCKKYLGLSESDLRSIDGYAQRHSFLRK
ncbi:MAG: adenosine deaminase [Bdellovibrionota bacterium]